MINDVFVENIAKKKRGPSTIILKTVIILSSVVLAALVFFAGVLIAPSFISALFFLALFIIFMGYILTTALNVEFETCLTNGIFDVDKIVNRRKRTRLVTFRCETVETIGRYNPAEHENKKYDNTFIACSDIEDEDVWFMTFRHHSLGHVLVVINANDRMLDGIKQFIPRQLAFEVFGRF
ncbi:MAG: hypothetical protein IJO96_00920 [Oscillospiraceae bacterium]|nr:hypothetical protein [Oscillospiraceae bacterium]